MSFYRVDVYLFQVVIPVLIKLDFRCLYTCLSISVTDPCANFPCFNGGTCMPSQLSCDQHECRCQGCYSGANCQTCKFGLFVCLQQLILYYSNVDTLLQ